MLSQRLLVGGASANPEVLTGTLSASHGSHGKAHFAGTLHVSGNVTSNSGGKPVDTDVPVFGSSAVLNLPVIGKHTIDLAPVGG